MEPFELMQWRMYAELVLALGVWPLLLGMFLVIGSRQSREGGGTAERLWLVASAAATLAALPMLIWIFVVLPPYSSDSSFSAAAALTFVSALLVGRHMGRPVRIIASSAALPLVDDTDFLARVDDLSRKMGIEPPRVRLLGSAADTLDTSAFVGGLPAPMVVMSDGAMHRLEARERDAVLAHELAHIATGSLWWLASIAPIAAVGGSFASAFLPPPVAVFTAFALFVGLRRAIGRRIEIACDLCAGEAMGHREMAAALSKIHAAHVVPDKGWMSFLAYATSTHPPLATRLAALKAAAPPDERDAIQVETAG